MSAFEAAPFDPAGFSGRTRLFPLPNLVLFPHILQPLHIFEPRYRALLEEALEGDRLIAMAVLAPGWEQDYEGRPSLYPFACLGRVATHHRLEDGRYNLLLQGVCRVAVVRELPPINPFREAEVLIHQDLYAAKTTANRQTLERALIDSFKRCLHKLPEALDQLDQALEGNIPLGMLTDLMAYALDLEVAFKQRLLAELDVDRRATLLLERLAVPSPGQPPVRGLAGTFPPNFSAN